MGLAKSYNATLPSKSITCKFRDSRFTAKIHYLQIELLANSHNPSVQVHRGHDCGLCRVFLSNVYPCKSPNVVNMIEVCADYCCDTSMQVNGQIPYDCGLADSFQQTSMHGNG